MMTFSSPDILFTNARLLDPASGLDSPGSLLVSRGLIADHGGSLGVPDGATVVDCGGAVLAPGLVDLRASLGEPGNEYRETIESAAEAAAAGGITTLCALPDTETPLDDPALLQYVWRRGEALGSLSILPYGAATRACAGKDLSEFGLL
jgi:dihydroorotase